MNPLVSRPIRFFSRFRLSVRTVYARPVGSLFLPDLASDGFGNFARRASNWRLHFEDAGSRKRCRRRPSIRVDALGAEAPESVFAHWRSVEAWYRDDPSLLRWRRALTRQLCPAARTSLQRDETVVPLDSCCFLRCPCNHAVYWLCLAKRSPALQACNRTRNSQADGVPRGTPLRRSNHACGAFLARSRSPELMP